MPRLLLASCLLLALAFATQAEEPLPQPIQKKEETLQLEEKNGKKVLKLAGVNEVSLGSLLRAWVEASSCELIFQPAQVAHFKVTIAVPEEGKTFDSAGIEALATDGLSEMKLVLVELSPGRFHIVTMVEAESYAPLVDVAGLKDIPGQRMVNLRWNTAFPTIFTQKAGATNLMRPEAMNMSRVPGIVLLCDRADRLRELIPSLEEIDRAAAKREIRVYASNSVVTPANVAKALDALIPKDVFVPQNAVSDIPGTRLLLVWALSEIQKLVPGVLKELAEEPVAPKAAPAPPVWAVRRYDLPGQAEVADVVAALEKLFDVTRTRRLTVVAIPGKKALAIRTVPEIHEQVAQFIETLK